MSKKSSEWVLELERNVFEGNCHLMTLSNGYMGVKGLFSELFDRNGSTIIVTGIYDQVGDAWNEIINEPDFWYNEIIIDGQKVELSDDNTEDFSVRLDMKESLLTLEYVFTTSKGKKIKIAHQRIVCFDKLNTAVWKFSIESLKGDADVSLIFGIDGEVIDDSGVHLEKFSTEELSNGFLMGCSTQQGKYHIGVSNRISVTADGQKIAKAKAQKTQKCIKAAFDFKLTEGKKAEIENVANIFTSRDSKNPVEDAKKAAENKACFDDLFASHKASLAPKWERADIIIEGDEKAQKYIRYNLHSIICGMPRVDYASVPARLLSTQTYKGAIFWDMDTHTFPFYAHLFPEAAKNHLMYRYKCLDGAREKAKALGYEGAFYAWESLDDGREMTKKFVWKDVNSGRMMRNYFGDRQYHITGDIIYAMWQYYQTTGDLQFVIDYGAEMALETARFVGSLVYYKNNKGRYEVMQTVCPDEYHEEVNNNPFTNRICKYIIDKAFEVKDLLAQKAPEKLESLMKAMKLEDKELNYLKDVSKRIYIIEPNEDNVVEEFDGYFDLEDILMDEFRKREKGCENEYYGFPTGIAVYTQILKQADILQLMHMFKNDYSPAVRKANYNYYDPRTEHGSSGSPYAYGSVAAQVGLIDDAYRYLMRSLAMDLESINCAGKADTKLGGLHLGSCGGSWQVLVYGFAGIELTDDVIRFNPVLPAGWRNLKFNVLFCGQMLGLEISQDKITITSQTDNGDDVNIQIKDDAVKILKPGQKVSKGY